MIFFVFVDILRDTKYLCDIYTSVVVDLCLLHYYVLFAVADFRDVTRSKVPCLYSNRVV